MVTGGTENRTVHGSLIKVRGCYLVHFSCSPTSTNWIYTTQWCCSKSLSEALAKTRLKIGPPLNLLMLIISASSLIS